jgi:opacity protein-like surface antigen
MKKLSTLLLIGSCVVAFSANAADLPSKKQGAKAPDTTCGSSWSVSAREWYTNHKTDPYSTSFDLPLTGGSMSYTPDNCSGITYTLTSLYGRTGEDQNGINLWEHKYNRWDSELSAQIPYVNNFAFNVGGRYVDFNDNTDNSRQNPRTVTNEYFNSKIGLAELGFLYRAPLSNSFSAFASLGYDIGYIGGHKSGDNTFPQDTTSSGGVQGFDAGIGVAYVFDKNWSSTLRYRYTGLTNTSFSGGMNSIKIQGPELNVTYRF